MSDPASKYLPELAGMNVARSLEGPLTTIPARREFTIQDLLRHTSGLTYKTRGASEAYKAYPDGMRDLARSSKAEFLEKLSAPERTNINTWLASCTHIPERDNNHAWFHATNQACRLEPVDRAHGLVFAAVGRI